MKKEYIYAMILAVVILPISACFSDDKDSARKSLEIENISKELATQAEVEESLITEKYSFSQGDLERTIKIIMEDDIWFKFDKSDFYSYINKEIDFMFYFDDENERFNIFTLIEKSGSMPYGKVLHIRIADGRLMKDYDSSESTNYDWIREWFIPEVTGRGIVSIGERRKPQYDASKEEIAYVVKNIQKELERNQKIGGGLTRENVFIRNFYKDSLETIMIYTYDGKQRGLSISLESDGHNRSKSYTLENQEYEDRLLECSIAVKKEKLLDIEMENVLKTMIKQKTEQALRSIIEDDILIKNEESVFYEYRNKEISYQYYFEYYYNRKDGFVEVFPIIESEGQTVFCEISFTIREDNFMKGKFYNDEQGTAQYLTEIQGSGVISIGEQQK